MCIRDRFKALAARPGRAGGARLPNELTNLAEAVTLRDRSRTMVQSARRAMPRMRPWPSATKLTDVCKRVAPILVRHSFAAEDGTRWVFGSATFRCNTPDVSPCSIALRNLGGSSGASPHQCWAPLLRWRGYPNRLPFHFDSRSSARCHLGTLR